MESSPKSNECTCPDCENTVPVSATFCPHCSQRIEVSPIDLGEIVAELFGSLVTLELPILRTTLGVLVKPGRIASEWIAGKRQTYMNPFKFIVVVGLIVALTYKPLQEWKLENAESGEAVYQVGLAHHATQYFAFFCIALLVPIALALRALDRWLGLGRSWLDWYVLGLYTYGIAVAMQLTLGILKLALPSEFAPTALRVLESLLPAAMLMLGAYGFVERNRRFHAVATAGVAQAIVVLAVVAWQSVRT